MRNRRGFTLIELTISVVLLLFIMGAAVKFLRSQSIAVSNETKRMDALQNAEFAATQIERELREAGAGTADVQPMIVQIDKEAITFNANMLSTDSGDVRAVYQSGDADVNAVRVMYKSERMLLPNSSNYYYPDSTYMEAAGVVSGAETISYYLQRDLTATTDSTYTLWRRVNALTPTLVARNIVNSPQDSIPFFTYYKQDTLGKLIAIAPNLYPIYHTVVHGAASDTGKSALTDSIRVVRVHFVALMVDRRAKKDSIKYRVVENKIRIMNSGLLGLTSCGQPPLGVGTPTLTQTATGSAAQKSVTIQWTRSGDDGIGEKDIERYAIFRRLSTAVQNGEPISSIPAKGLTTYTYNDATVKPGDTYIYGVAAQDCTPNVSAAAQSASILINP